MPLLWLIALQWHTLIAINAYIALWQAWNVLPDNGLQMRHNRVNDIRWRYLDLFHAMLIGAHQMGDIDTLESIARSANKRLTRPERKELNISWGYYLDDCYPQRRA